VTASSKYKNNEKREALLTDGEYQHSVEDPWIGFHSAFEENPWVQIDLGKPYNVDVVKVSNNGSLQYVRERETTSGISRVTLKTSFPPKTLLGEYGKGWPWPP
jgi:hypothetical protein